MTVTRAELEAFISEIRASVSDPRAGIFGPGTWSWTINRESILFLGAGRAALLQLAHPWVAHGVDQHSAARSDPLGRFRRTFENVFGMLFGDLERACRAARRVHAVHARVSGEITEDAAVHRRGDRYRANDEHALLWVHATLLETAVQVYELVVRRLEPSERERYYEESKRFARLFGISDRVLPADWRSFAAYCDGMLASDTLGASAAARDLASFLFRPAHAIQRPLFGWFRIMTAALLPERLRRDFGFPYGALDQEIFRSSLTAIRATYPRLPLRVRCIPAYNEARRRISLG